MTGYKLVLMVFTGRFSALYLINRNYRNQVEDYIRQGVEETELMCEFQLRSLEMCPSKYLIWGTADSL